MKRRNRALTWVFPILTGVLLALASCGPDANDASEQVVETSPDGQAVASVALAAPGGTCSAPLKKCSGICVDLLTDYNNCGRCGNVCGADGGYPICINGYCLGSCPKASACGVNCIVCPKGTTCICGTRGCFCR